MEKDIYVMENPKVGKFIRGEFENDEEIAAAQKIINKNLYNYRAEKIKAYKYLGIFREKWDPEYKEKMRKEKELLKAHANREDLTNNYKEGENEKRN